MKKLAIKQVNKRFFIRLAAVTLILAVLLLIFSLVFDRVSAPPVSNSTPTPPTPVKKGLEVPASFTLEDKIGQLLIVGVTSKSVAVDFESHYQIGGFLIRPDSDLFNADATNAVKKAGQLPPLFAVDEEGGQIARLPGADYSKYSARYMSNLSNAEVKRIAFAMGQKMTAVGANLDFAPVVDLDNGQNTAISTLDRAFSSDPQVVAQKAGAFAAGLRKAGVAPTFKHFPGLGNAYGPTGGNTDTGPATTPDIASLERNDLLPYETLLNSSAASTVMVGNQIVPGLTGNIPASFSPSAYDLLRHRYDFNQLIFTDELLLAKAALSAEPRPQDAVIAVIKAGADMPLIDTDDPATIEGIVSSVAAAVRSGQISESQIDKSLAREMALKTWVGQQ